MREQTIFEKIINRELPADIIYEDEEHLVILDINPFEKGHILVIPKHHYETIMDMSEEAYLQLQSLVHRFALRMHQSFGGGINVVQNNYPEAHQVVPHVHVHLIPRTEDKPMYHSELHTGGYESDEEKESFISKLKLV
ncbi:MAG: HIT family protein [Patescibacteria group bacterium]